MKKEIVANLSILLLVLTLFQITFRTTPAGVSGQSEVYREVWKQVNVTNPWTNNTVADISMSLNSRVGVYIAWSTNVTSYFESPAGYTSWWDWLNGVEGLPYHWGEMDWFVSEGSLTDIDYDEIQHWGDMYMDSGGSVAYQTFMDNTYMADWNLTEPNNDPDIIPFDETSVYYPWQENKIRIIDNLVVPAASTVNLIFKIVMTEPGVYAFNVTSPQDVDISPSSWRIGGAATILVPDEHATIQAAIDAASPSDTIIVDEGTYVEDLSIDATKTNLEIKPDAGASVTIKGVQNVPAGSWPLALPNIEIDASGVRIHGFTIESPDYADDYYSSGMIIGASDVEIYNNTFKMTSAADLGEISQAIQTYHKSAKPGVDISGLNIHDNLFMNLSPGAAGYEGIYINLDEGSNTVTVQHNRFYGSVVRAVTTERSKTTIFSNTITTDLAPGLPGGYQGINVGGANAGNVTDVLVTGNTINGSASGKGFEYGIKLGYSGTSTFTNVVVTGNTIQMSEVGVFVKFSADGVKVNLNNVYGNTDYGVSNADSATLDAENNWWGDGKGPGNVAVDPPVMLTTDSHYDRNPSFFVANDGTWWLFFVRASDSLPHVPPTYNPDAATYDVWYMTSTDNGFSWSAETKITPTTSQRGMAAFEDDTGKIWVFVSSPGAGAIQYYTSTDGGGTWTGPTTTGYSGSHVDAFQASDGKIWVFYEGGTGIEAIKSSDYGGGWILVTGIGPSPNDGIPKVIEADGKLYVVWCNWAVGAKAWYTTSTDGLTGDNWNSPTLLVDVPGTIMCDPVLCKDSYGVFWLFYAPWSTVTDSQWIEYVKSTDSGATWSAPTSVTPGGYGTTYWWDMWPEVAQDRYGGKIVLFYGSESSADETTRIDGNIWMMTVWAPTVSIGDYVSENVDFKPWLIQPYPPAVPVSKIYVDPSSKQYWTPAYGGNFTIKVKTDVTLLAGFQFKLTWDGTLLNLTDAVYSPPWRPYFEVENETLTSGSYTLALTGQNNSFPYPFNGSTTLATLTFQIIYDPVWDENATCDLKLEDVILSDRESVPFAFLAYDGTYSINSTKPMVALQPQETVAKKVPLQFDVEVSVTNIVNLYGCDFNLTYNPAMIEALTVKVEPFFNGSYSVAEQGIDNEKGFVFVRVNSISPPANGSGTIARITFKVKTGAVWPDPALTCDIAFYDSKLLREGLVEMAHDAVDGKYRYEPIKGDLNMDGLVELYDLVRTAQAFGSKLGDSDWDPLADLIRDDVINILDIIVVASNFGSTS